MRRLVISAALAVMTLPFVGVGIASAFEPPSDPVDVFTCVNGTDPVSGFPGATGQFTQFASPGFTTAHAASKGTNVGAWSAALNPNTPVTLC
jgi:hypothetical protein